MAEPCCLSSCLTLRGRIEKELITFGKLVKVRLNNSYLADFANSDKEYNLVKRQKEIAGEVFFKTLSPFNISLLDVADIFVLIDDKVRYVKSPHLKKDKAYLSIRLKDEGLVQELKKAKLAFIATDKHLYEDLVVEKNSLNGMSVIHEGKKIAVVIDSFNNNAHDVLIALTDDNQEILLPVVDEYVLEKDFERQRIVFKNIQEFFDF